MRELALLGCGVALLPENFVRGDLERGALQVQKMPLQWKREYGLLVHKHYNSQTPFIQDFKLQLSHNHTACLSSIKPI